MKYFDNMNNVISFAFTIKNPTLISCALVKHDKQM
jgi:hypothetical protein